MHLAVLEHCAFAEKSQVMKLCSLKGQILHVVPEMTTDTVKLWCFKGKTVE